MRPFSHTNARALGNQPKKHAKVGVEPSWAIDPGHITFNLTNRGRRTVDPIKIAFFYPQGFVGYTATSCLLQDIYPSLSCPKEPEIQGSPFGTLTKNGPNQGNKKVNMSIRFGQLR